MKMFAFLFLMLSFATKLSIVDDSGVGSDAGSTEGEGGTDGNIETNGADDVSAHDDADDGSDENTEVGDASLTPEEIKEAKEIIADKQREAMLSEVEKSIQERTPNFDMKRVAAGLKELHKTDPKMAAYYNASEAGLEMFFRDKLANVAANDAINSGSHAGNNSDFGSTLDKARSGNSSAVKSALAMSKA